ncbi:MAG: hypothetical protein JW976_09270 [Syntrophaceae bacterium]|nr:hypothetical protein [Syntrophaceae bacterium]
MINISKKFLYILIIALTLFGCEKLKISDKKQKPRLSMFIGVDISGSFIKSDYFDDSLDFLAHYLYAHLNGLGDLEIPNALFVGSIGGEKAGEPKTFFPIQTFENKSLEEISKTLQDIFPKDKINPFTDYNAFFDQIALNVKNRNLLLRPVSIVMVSDGIPDINQNGNQEFSSINVKPLENLARNITIRLIYTDAVTGQKWQTKVKRNRVKMWTQDAKVMTSWRDSNILLPDVAIAKQTRFFSWIKENVDFGVRSLRINY